MYKNTKRLYQLIKTPRRKETSPCRSGACRGLEFMGISLNEELNNKVRGEEVIISKPDSKVKVLIIPTDEEFMIASDTMEILKGE